MAFPKSYVALPTQISFQILTHLDWISVNEHVIQSGINVVEGGAIVP